MLTTIRSGFALLERRDRVRWVITLASSVLISAVEVASAAMVLVLMKFLTEDPTAARVPLLGVAGERWPDLSEGELILVAVLVTGSLFLVRAGLFLVNTHLQFRVAYGAGVRLSSRLARRYLSMPYRWHLEHSSAQLMTNVVEAVNQVVVYVLIPSASVISNGLLALTLVAVLFLTDAASALAGALFLGTVILAVLRIVRPRLGALARHEIEGYEQSVAAVQETLAGIREVKVLALEDHAVARVTRGRTKQGRANYMRSTLTAIPRMVVETAAVLAMLAFLAVRHESASSDQALATLGVFGYAIIRLLPTVSALMASINTLQYGAPAVEKLAADLALVGEPEEVDDAAELPAAPDLVLRGVGFRYGSATDPALRGVDLTIRFGESVGIVGPTGSGKTTLLDVMAGLLEPTEGQISAGGVPLTECRRSWQRRLGVVPQSVVLVNDTLAANIAIGESEVAIDRARLSQAVGRAQLDDVVAGLPHGLDTDLGERGIRLSGGQRQRVAIARALYRRPSVLIFDEGTAALDTATEADLIDSLNELRGSLTMLMVAHRLSTVRFCDRILVVEAGRITGDGSFDELAQSCAGFQRLVRDG